MTLKKNAELEPLLTTVDLARYLQVPVATVYRWNSHGTGPKFQKIGRHVRYLRSEVDRWVREGQPSG